MEEDLDINMIEYIGLKWKVYRPYIIFNIAEVEMWSDLRGGNWSKIEKG